MDEKAEPREKKTSPPSSTEEPQAAPQRIDVVVRGAASRCPHCHDQVSADGDAWAACRSCLARHHVACWGEGGACASCGDHRFVSSLTTKAGVQRVPSKKLGWLAVIFATTTLVLGIGALSLKIQLDQLRGVAIQQRDEIDRLTDDVAKERIRAKKLESIAEDKAQPDLTAHTFDVRENRSLAYRALGSNEWTTTSMPNTRLDEYALAIAKHVVNGDVVQDPRTARAVLSKVLQVMKKDPARKDDVARVGEALAILESK